LIQSLSPLFKKEELSLLNKRKRKGCKVVFKRNYAPIKATVQDIYWWHEGSPRSGGGEGVDSTPSFELPAVCEEGIFQITTHLYAFMSFHSFHERRPACAGKFEFPFSLTSPHTLKTSTSYS